MSEGCHAGFASANGAATVDLQWAFAQLWFAFPIGFEDLSDRLEPVSVGGTTVWQPAPSDLLLILCGHGTKHCWSKLGWISDVAEFSRVYRDTIDWGKAMERAASLGGERLVLLGLLLARDLLGVDLPVEVLREYGPSQPSNRWPVKRVPGFSARITI